MTLNSESSRNENLPSPKVSYIRLVDENSPIPAEWETSASLISEDGVTRAERTFIEAVQDSEAESFSRSKRAGEKIRRKADFLKGSSFVDDYMRNSVTGAGLATAANYGLAVGATHPTELGLYFMIPWVAGGVGVASGLTRAPYRALNGVGRHLEQSSDNVEVTSDNIEEIKSNLSDPNNRPNNLYGIGFGEYIELHDREGVERTIDSLAEEYPEAEWVLTQEEDHPFQVIGMLLSEEYNGSEIEDDNDIYQFRREAEDNLGEEVLMTESGKVPTSRRISDSPDYEEGFDVVIVDRNPDYKFITEENFLDYSETFTTKDEISVNDSDPESDYSESELILEES